MMNALEGATMGMLKFVIQDTGKRIVVDTEGHRSVMSAAVENDIPGIEGECGGEMSCGTCHVYVESAPEGYAPEQTADEIDMLEAVGEPRDVSRLSCQLPLDEQADGLVVLVPQALS
ncbi:2Fe-2S iron-sulfur cluster-binding protein [Streptomyces mirabilis]|uniref:2Fe-2S iron-sulfur cluster-binding protein n=1 Tax=Streptomyces mirabilis TaxID=68239 RepID=UPI0036AF0035